MVRKDDIEENFDRCVKQQKKKFVRKRPRHKKKNIFVRGDVLVPTSGSNFFVLFQKKHDPKLPAVKVNYFYEYPSFVVALDNSSNACRCLIKFPYDQDIVCDAWPFLTPDNRIVWYYLVVHVGETKEQVHDVLKRSFPIRFKTKITT